MPVSHLTLDTLQAWIRGLSPEQPPSAADEGLVIVVDLDADHPGPGPGPAAELHTGIANVVIGLTTVADSGTHPHAPCCDVALDAHDDAVEAIVATVERQPLAATAAAVLLRGAERRTIDDGLAAESAVYSALQAGPEFRRWRAEHPRHTRAPEGAPVIVARTGDVVDITLDRPQVRNALDAAMRDHLVDAFRLAALDSSISEVHLRGTGAAFCAGGDLDEFGSFTDPASAHLLRLHQSAGRAIATVAERVTAHLHGACVGSGIELAAFAHRVVAHPSTLISLPEVSLGLVPGAGGTVSLPRRIGRHRTARLVLTGEQVDAPTARRWGLVDAVEDA